MILSLFYPIAFAPDGSGAIKSPHRFSIRYPTTFLILIEILNVKSKLCQPMYLRYQIKK